MDKEFEIGRSCSMHSELRHVYKILRRLAVDLEVKEMCSKNVM